MLHMGNILAVVLCLFEEQIVVGFSVFLRKRDSLWSSNRADNRGLLV